MTVGDKDPKKGYVVATLPTKCDKVEKVELKEYTPKKEESNADSKDDSKAKKENDGKEKSSSKSPDALNKVEGTDPKALKTGEYIIKDEGGKKKMMISGSNFSKNKITAVMIEYSEKKSGSTDTKAEATTGKDNKKGLKKMSSKKGVTVKNEALTIESLPSGDDDDKGTSIWRKWWFILLLVVLAAFLIWAIFSLCTSSSSTV